MFSFHTFILGFVNIIGSTVSSAATLGLPDPRSNLPILWTQFLCNSCRSLATCPNQLHWAVFELLAVFLLSFFQEVLLQASDMISGGFVQFQVSTFFWVRSGGLIHLFLGNIGMSLE